uniref:SAM domain-containing protein n=1 Tax=Phytophthora ramorum TaxID=164328 RepID=H3GWY8_PHYRM
MSIQLEEDLRRVLRLARAEAKANKLKGSGKGSNISKVHQPEHRHRHDQYLTGSKGERPTLLTAQLHGLSAIYGLDASSRHLGKCGSKSVLYRQHKDGPEEDDEALQQRLDTRRTLYKRHFAGALADSSGRKREMEHVLEAAAREARSSRVLGVGIGAAILTDSQSIYAAGAVENGAMALCAERAAVVKMLTAGTTANPVVVAMAICNRTPLEVKDWTAEHVVRWLERDVELPQYRDVFERNAVDGCTLVLLEASDLQLLLGITHPLHRSKLLTYVDRLRDRELLARGLDYTQLEDYLAVLDIDRVSAVAQLKTTFDRLDADHDGVAADPDSNAVEASAQAIERLLHSEGLFGKEAATSGNVSFPAFARAFSKLATQPADTPTATQGAFAVHAFGPRLPVLGLSNLRKCFDQQTDQGTSLEEPGLVRLLKELGQSEARSTELACRWLDAQDEVDEASDAISFAQFIARYAQLIDTNAAAEGAEASGVARLHQLFTSYEPVHSTRRKPRTVVQRALSTLFPTVPGDEVSVWCASFWPPKLPKPSENGNNSGSKKQVTTTLSFPEFALACLEFAAEAYAREQEAATIKRSLRNDALVHRSRVVHLHNSGHVRMCPQIPSDTTEPGTKQDPSKTRQISRDSDEEDGKRADREGKAQDSGDEGRNQQYRRRGRREQQVDEAFDRFARRHGAQTLSTKDDDAKQNSDDDEEDAGSMLNAVEAAQAALELVDVHFDSGRHLRNVEFSGLRVLNPEDELLSGAPKAGFNVGSRVSVAHKGTKTRRQGKIVLCRTEGTFDVLVNEFGAPQTLKRIARTALALINVQPTVYRVGARVMVRQRTEYLRGKVCACRTDGSFDVKLARSPQKIIQRLAPELLTLDDGEDGDSDDDIDETEKDPPAKSKPTPPSKKVDSDDDFEPEFARGDRVEARFGGQAAYYPGTIERVHPNGSCDISYDDGDEEERVAPRLIRLPSNPTARKPTPSKKKPSSDNGYDSDLFDSD